MVAVDGDAPAQLSAELHALLLRRLKHEWVQINWALFGDAMRCPLFELIESTNLVGVWRPGDRTIAMARRPLLTRPWAETVETIKHEAAHQFVHEILGVDEPPHGPSFRRACQARGIDPRARESRSALEGGAARTQEDRVVARVQKLLALAESANEHEAELAAATAQRIMLKYNLDLQQRSADAPADCGFLWLGEPTGRVQAHERHIATLLVDHFFVQALWIPTYRPLEGKPGSVLEICGRPENLAMAQYVHHFLLRAVEHLWREHKRAAGLSSNRDRRSFLAGAVTGFADKLETRQRAARREGLVWVGDAHVREYFRRRHPRIVTVGRSSGGSHEAYASGQSAGRNIVLSRPVTSETTRRERRALGPAR